MTADAIARDDPNRVEVLRAYDIVDMVPEPAFDRLAKLAAQLCGVSGAAITFANGARQFLKARVGFLQDEALERSALWRHWAQQTDAVVIADATQDARFAQDPLVTGAAAVRLYAAIPLIVAGGHTLGTLCVFDRSVHCLADAQIEALRTVASAVVAELELRRTRKRLEAGSSQPDATSSARYDADAFLRSLVEGTVASTGTEFLRELVRNVASALGIRYAFVGRLLPNARIRALAFWSNDDYVDGVEYNLEGTPCTKVMQGDTCHYAQDVQKLFPRDDDLVRLGVTSYLGVPLRDPNGAVLGHLVAMDVKPMLLTAEEIKVFRLFGERAGVELYRHVIEQSLEDREMVLRAIAEGTAAAVGAAFFPCLVRNLAGALGVEYAFASEFCADRTKVRTLAFWSTDHLLDNFEYAVAGTPCEAVLAGTTYHCADNVAARFPEHREELEALHVRSYLAIPMFSAAGQVLGHLAVMDTKRLDLEQLDLSIFKIFGVRAGVELDRMHMEARLKDNEERLRDLFDEAPIAYVHEGLDSRFIRANRTAMRLLGIGPDEVAGTYGKNFVPNTPEAQARLKQALDAIGRGTDTSGVVLELRRRDNGLPLWIQWWSRPDPSGTFTRTMFIDITERVLMEQEKARLEAQNTYLREEVKGVHNFEELVGNSAALRRVLRDVERVAPTDSSVLISGETGTGKELIARAIHNLSPRRDKPLVKVNCSAIPAGLIESEFFGHEKGAFTGALTRKLGRFEVADKGTLFLDEIGDLPLDLQAKLLRVLQEGEFERVGGTQTFKVNVRVIAATNRDLDRLAKAGEYRADLYYRLNVFPVHLPPLRERDGDVVRLAQYFVQKTATSLGKKIHRIPERVMATLARYPWPGNVRELEHVIERAVILSEGPELAPIDWLSTDSGAQAGAEPTPTLEALERQHIVDVLEKTEWRVSGAHGAAAILGLKPTTLEARMKKLGIARAKRAS